MTIIFFGTIVAAILAERVPSLRRRRLPLFRPHAFTDVAFLLVAWIAIADLTLRWVNAATGIVHVDLGLPALPRWPLVVEVVLALLLLDLGNYTCHWLMHRCPVLWRFHAVHHSSPALDWLATFRSHPIEQILRRAIAPVFLIVAGMSPVAVALASAIFVAWGTLNHANVVANLRFLEGLLITPRLHQWHHVEAMADHNLGTLFSIWDRLRGRLETREVAGDALLGNGDHRYPQSFLALLRRPFQEARGRFE
jgi:sterol desaturase/sphingolipid hydroxylase (fatty acid hydroxylase superfamily)